MDDVSMTGTVVSAGSDSCAVNEGESEKRHTAAKNEVHLMAKPPPLSGRPREPGNL
jgi:hypothetical protein